MGTDHKYMVEISQHRRLSLILFVVPQDAFLRKAENLKFT